MFVDGERWNEINLALNGAGVPSMQAKWNEMFAPKVEEVKAVKPKAKKTVSKKKTTSPKTKSTKSKPTTKKTAAKKTEK
jgi:hypothetical protein